MMVDPVLEDQANEIGTKGLTMKWGVAMRGAELLFSIIKLDTIWT